MLRNVLSRIKWGLMVFGVLMLVFGIYECVMAHKTPFDLNRIPDSEIKPGILLEGDVYGNYGAYEEYYNTRYGIKDKSSTLWYYIIPVGEESFMGVSVNANKRGAEFDRQSDETYDYLTGATDKAPTPLHVKGKVAKMDSEDLGLYKTALREIGFSESEIDQYALPYYIGSNSFDSWLVLLIVGVVILAIGVVLIFVTRRRV